MAVNPVIISPISDIVVSPNTTDTTLNLLSHFDDPSTTGLVAQFRLYNTNLGNGLTNVVLFDQAGEGTPLTVQNFLNYVNGGDYTNSIIHRSVEGFVVQGGGFTVNNLELNTVPTDEPVVNEFSPNRSNLRGTIAMAKLGDDPNSATSQWFFNLGDNSANLDNQNGGFTVFGQVLSQDDLNTIDAIATVPVYNASSINGAFTDIPLILAENSSTITDDSNFVRYQSITVSQLNELNFTVINNTNPSVANVITNGSTLLVDYLPNAMGTTQITIRGTSLLGQIVDDTFSITVFDAAQYGASNPDLIPVFGYNLEALTNHYYTYGQAEGRNLSGFNSSQYLASYDDLILALGNNPEAATAHYLQYGYYEGRSPDSFQEDIYLASNPDLIQFLGYNLEGATQHYINYGIYEGRPKNNFDPFSYLNNNPDLQSVFGTDTVAATQHYITYGYGEGRTWIG